MTPAELQARLFGLAFAQLGRPRIAARHFLGRRHIFTLAGDRVTAGCLAQRVAVNGGYRLMLASYRYYGMFVKMDGARLFAERWLYVNWVDERALS